MSSTSAITQDRPRRKPSGSPARRFQPLLRFIVTPLIASLVVLAALDEGASSPASRSVAAIVVWWTLSMAVAFAVVPRARLGLPAALCAGLLLAFALLTGLSSGWAPSAEGAITELDRVLLYAGLLLLPIALARRGEAGRWVDGLALGIAVVGALALGQRLFPDAFPTDTLAAVLPRSASRLTYPLGYWNGLASFAALGIPLLLRAATAGRHWLTRAAALAPIPVLACVIYLASSRGGVAVAVVGAAVFAVATGYRLRALLGLAIAGAGSAAAIAVLAARPALVDGPFDAATRGSAGTQAALLIVAVCVLAALIFGALSVVVPARLPLPRLAWAALGVLVLVALVAVHPASRLREFKAPPADTGVGAAAIDSHLASGGGSGRWQFWDAAVHQFSAHPLTGGGAGSYESWWAQHGSLDWFVRNAHSLWLETLGELGLLGLLLLGGAFAVGIAAGVARLRGRSDADRTTTAALLAALLAFTVGAAIDWVWQLPSVAAVGVLALGLLVSPGTQPESADDATREEQGRSRLGIAPRAVLLAGGVIVLVVQFVPYLTNRAVESSQQAVVRGDLTAAADHARSARGLAPWAASPRLQLALVHERAGQVDLARRDLAGAIYRDDHDWRLQLVASRLAVEARDIPAARAALARARHLNPRSPLLRSLGAGP